MVYYDKLTPLGGILLSEVTSGLTVKGRTNFFKYFTMCMTFVTYMSYHMTRKVVGVVTPVLKNGSEAQNDDGEYEEKPWAPFDGGDQDSLIAGLDLAFLLAYALGMFVSGHLAERIDLRYFLTAGMTASSVFCCFLGLGKVFGIHNYIYYVICQLLSGLAQSTGWPAVVPCMGNWFGFGKRGFILGVWNSHTSVGNILGSVIAGAYVDQNWALSFIVPAIIMFAVTVMLYLFLVPYPELVFCTNPNHSSGLGLSMSMSVSPNSISRERLVLPDLAEEYPILQETSVTVPAEKDELATWKVDRDDSVKDKAAVGIIQALKVPGVVEYALCLFFNKLVSYSFLYWLPTYIKESLGSSSQEAANLSTFFDAGGLAGGIIIGTISDFLGERSLVTAVSIIAAAPLMFLYQSYGDTGAKGIVLLVFTGMAVNGPYALITTAISSDLGTHKCLRANKRALATVTAIIDGTGSMGAAIGAFTCFMISNKSYDTVFYMLIASDVISLLFLVRLLRKSVKYYIRKIKR